MTAWARAQAKQAAAEAVAAAKLRRTTVSEETR